MSIFSDLSQRLRDVTQRAELATRLRGALYHADTRSPGLQDRLEAVLARAHAEAAAVLDGHAARTELGDLAGAWAMLRSDVDRLEDRVAGAVEGEAPVYVGSDGTLWGIGKYLTFDPGWIEALAHWLENHDHPAPFVDQPQIIDLPDQVSLDIVGDWGTGFWSEDAGPRKVRDLIAADRADVNIHLGDVYYAGSSTQEQDNFLALWPPGTRGSFTLNSNHEMYDGARAYFTAALAATGPFAAQHGTSYFALRTSYWLIVGLDSAYHATGDLYLDGAINASQGAFLARLGVAAEGRKVMVLSHHLGADLTGTTPTALWQQVAVALGRVPDVWYWGHAHNGVVYAPLDGCRIRCVGHGAIPYGPAALLAGLPSVVWSETQAAGDPDLPARVLNGYVRVRLDGATLREELVGEDGSIRWHG